MGKETEGDMEACAAEDMETEGPTADELAVLVFEHGNPEDNVHCIHKHPSNGCVFVGDVIIARDLSRMIKLGITHVVNCGKYVKNHVCDDYFEQGSKFLTDAAHRDTYGVTVPDELPDPPIQYFDFDIEHHPHKRTEVGDSTDEELAELQSFCAPVCNWIDDVVASGSSVLVHCRAGKHRAGTTGVMYMMHSRGLDSDAALAHVQGIRPVSPSLSAS